MLQWDGSLGDGSLAFAIRDGADRRAIRRDRMTQDVGTAEPLPAIRPATPADGPTIERLVLALAEFERLDPPDAAARARLLADAFGPRPRVTIWLAEVDGQIAGYAFF